jgi:hypothetical protein
MLMMMKMVRMRKICIRTYSSSSSSVRWLICDMDNTLLDKQPGSYPRFRASPCYDPLLRWIDLGGRVLVVTSDDGKRPLEQFYKEIPDSHRDRVLLSTAGGAVLYRSPTKFDLNYWNREEGGGGLADPISTSRIACNLIRSYLLDSYVSPSLLDHLQPSRHEKIQHFFSKYTSLDSLSSKLEENDEQFLSHGALIEGLSFVWTNRCDYGVTNMFILGMPQSISPRYVTTFVQDELLSFKSDCSFAPNSVCIKSSGVDKNTPVNWLHINDDDFSVSNYHCLAIGDNPNGNDRALTLFSELNFFNVGNKPFIKNGCYEVGGGFEYSTAFLISSLVALWKRRGSLPLFHDEFVSSLADAVRERHWVDRCAEWVSK